MEKHAYKNKAFELEKAAAEVVKDSKPSQVEAQVEAQAGPQDEKSSNRIRFLIMKNVLVISFAFFLLFSSFTSMANLQSSINPGTGTTSLSVVYGALVLSCAFVPSWLISRLRVKWTMVLCVLGYSAYIAAQFYPSHYTLIPTAAILGLGAAPMWSAKCTYLTTVGAKYGELSGENSDVVITRFFGIFFLFFQSTQVAGNLISSTVLSRSSPPPRTEEELSLCGAGFCPGAIADNSTLLTRPEPTQIYTMASIYLLLSLLSSIVIATLVDPLTRFVADKVNPSGASGTSLLIATFKHMRHPYQMLLIPLTMYSGLEQGYIGADYTAAYVSCGLGVHMVGYVMICFGACDALCSIAFTPLVKRIGRVPVFTLAAVVNGVAIAVMMLWTPHPDQLGVFFLIPALWGISDAVWQTQINALYGVVFPGQSEAAFSNYRLWESLGFIINYATQGALCNTNKLYIVIAFLCVGIAGYYTVEVMERRKIDQKEVMDKKDKVTKF